MSGERPLRVLLVGDYENDPRFGSAKALLKLCEALTALGHTCHTLLADELGRRPRGRQMRQLLAPLLAARAVAGRRGAPYDVLDISSAEGLWIAARRRMRRLPGSAVIARSHGLEHRNYARMLGDARAGLLSKPWTRRLWYPASRLSQVALAARLSDRLIVLNGGDRDYAVSAGWKRAEEIDVVPHGVSARFLDAAPGDVRERGAGALFCGTWDLVKGTPYLVEAWNRLAAQGARIPLTILGPGVPAASVLGAFSAAAQALITVIERSPEDVVIDAYRRHDVLVFPSTYEGFGLVVLEAMSQGLPVITTPVGCAPMLVADDESGTVVTPRDGGAIAGAVLRLMGDAALRERLAARARSAVHSLSWRKTAVETERVYRAALARRR